MSFGFLSCTQSTCNFQADENRHTAKDKDSKDGKK